MVTAAIKKKKKKKKVLEPWKKICNRLKSIFKSRGITLQLWESWSIQEVRFEYLMVLNCGVGEYSWESLGLQGDQSSQSWWKSWWKPEYSLKVLLLKLKLWYFGHLMQRTDYRKRPWCWESLRAEGEGPSRGWGGQMLQLIWCTWVWGNSGS